MVAGQDHHIEIRGDLQHPVELRERVMQIGYRKQTHRVPVLKMRNPRGRVMRYLWRDAQRVGGCCLLKYRR